MITDKHIIMKALGMTEMQYGQMVYQYAQAWMARYFGTEEAVIGALHHSKHFWSWWNGQWSNRDHEFIRVTGIDKIAEQLDVTEREVTKWLYLDSHKVDELKIVPNRMVAKEVGKLIVVETEKLKKLLNEK